MKETVFSPDKCEGCIAAFNSTCVADKCYGCITSSPLCRIVGHNPSEEQLRDLYEDFAAFAGLNNVKAAKQGKSTMKPITAYTDEERQAMLEKWNALKQKIGGEFKTGLFDNYRRDGYYAHYEFSGDISDRLIAMLGREPSAEEIIMIVDNGFYHFGATCEISGRHFAGEVDID